MGNIIGLRSDIYLLLQSLCKFFYIVTRREDLVFWFNSSISIYHPAHCGNAINSTHICARSSDFFAREFLCTCFKLRLTHAFIERTSRWSVKKKTHRVIAVHVCERTIREREREEGGGDRETKRIRWFFVDFLVLIVPRAGSLFLVNDEINNGEI